MLLMSSSLACLPLGLDHALLKLELSRGASDLCKTTLGLTEARLDWWALGLLSQSLGSKLDFRVLLFTGVAELARSLAIRVNQRSTSSAHSYSCCWPGYGYLAGYSVKGES